MSGTSSVLAPPLGSSALGEAGNTIPLSAVNSYGVNAIAERLALHVQLGNRSDPAEFYNLCLSLSRSIDCALANGQIPDKAGYLPTLMKQICQRKNDEVSQAAAMVLMISVKNACKIGWFQTKESEELFTIADEMGKIYCSIGNVNAGPSSCHPTIPTIMERFYPKMKLGRILASIEAKPGYGASTVDFHIAKSTGLKDKIWLLVAQTDDIETSACIISPQQVNFLLNGKGVDKRTNIQMDTESQMPTDVTGMLKCGSNLLQAVGQFNGHYVIPVAYMSVTSLLEHPVLQDYVQPAVASVDSDSNIIEGPSQISLTCPISFTRIKTPVKGRSCKHFQCFDFDNFIYINSRRPSWRCPHCKQCVSYADIRLDRNMVEVLKDVGENVVEVIVHADGSWMAVSENNYNVDKMHNKAHNYEEEQTEPHETTFSPGTVPNVLDLTNDDDQMEIMGTFETADGKHFQASVHGQFVTPNSTSFGMNSVGVNQNVTPHVSLSNPTTEDGFNAILSDTERQQYFSRFPMNWAQVSGVNSSTLQHHSAMQNRVPPVNMSAPGQLNPYRASGLLSESRNSRPPQPQSDSRPGDFFRHPPDQNWRPATRMRGSLDSKELTDDLRRRIIAPTTPIRSSRP